MTADDALTVAEAAARYVATLPADSPSKTDILAFARWFEADRRLRSVRGHDVDSWVQTLGPANLTAQRRVESVRNFLAYLKKHGLTEINLASHVRYRRPGGRGGPRGNSAGPASERKALTAEGHEALVAELAALKAERPVIAAELAGAMADKDFRENAPLDAARDRQAHLEARIRQIEEMLRIADVVTAGGGEVVRLGSGVTLINIASGTQRTYTIVSQNEVNPSQGRISADSPVGRAVLGRRAGDEVDVSAPSGTARYRIQEITH